MTAATDPKTAKTATERNVRNYALHLGLLVRRRGRTLTLSERYGERRLICAFRSWTWPDVWRAIARCDEQIAEIDAALARRDA